MHALPIKALKSLSFSTLFLLSCGIQTQIFAQDTSPTPAPAQPVECGVPVCDIPALIAEWGALDAALRGNHALEFFNGIREKYHTSHSEAVWGNLKEFSKEAAALFRAKEDQKWLIREGDDLYSLSIYNLLQYMAFDKVKASEYYQLLTPFRGYRYNIILLWEQTATAVEGINPANRKFLLELMELADQARVISLKLSQGDRDEDYVGREADTFIALLTKRLTEFDPFMEAIYSVKFTPHSGVSAPAMCKNPDFEKMFLWYSHNENGLVLSFANKTQISSGVRRVKVAPGGNDMFGIDDPNRVGAKFRFTLLREQNAIRGIYSDTRSSCTFDFTGSMLRSINDLGPTLAPPPFEQLAGVYEGVVNGMPTTLVLKTHPQTGDQVLSASANMGLFVMQLEYGYYSTIRKTVTLRSGDAVASVVQYNLLTDRDSDGKITLKGFFFSTINNIIGEISFKRVRDVDDFDAGQPIEPTLNP